MKLMVLVDFTGCILCKNAWTSQTYSSQETIIAVEHSLFKLLVKDKLLHSGKVPVNAELSPLRREKRRTEVQRYGTLNEAMKI